MKLFSVKEEDQWQHSSSLWKALKVPQKTQVETEVLPLEAKRGYARSR